MMSLLSKLVTNIKALDMIGRKPNMRIEDKKRFTTYLGGFLSIFIYVLIILSFLYFGQEIYLKRYPQLSKSKHYVFDQTEQIMINNDTVWILFFLKDKNENYLRNFHEFLNIKTHIKEQNNTSVTNLEIKNAIVKCDEIESLSLIFNSSSLFNYYSSLISNGFCISGVHLNEMITQNYFFSRKLNINIEVKNFINNISSIEVLYSKISDFSDSFSIIDNLNFNKYQSHLSPNIIKKINLDLKRLNYNTDDGLIMTKYISKNFAQIEKIYEQVIDYTVSSDSISFEIEISLLLMKNVIYRQYLKIQMLLAAVGGITKAFLMFAYCLNHVHNSTRYYEKLISEIFDVKDLRKNFQFYETDTKKYFKKYRNSIALKRVKDFEYLKREISYSNVSNMGTRHNNFLKNDFSTVKFQINSENANEAQLKSTQTEKKVNFDNGVNFNTTNPLINASVEENNNIYKTNQDIYNIEQIAQNVENKSKVTSKKDDLTNLMNYTNLKKNKSFKLNFEKVKHERFNLRLIDIYSLKLCCKSKNLEIQNNILESGKFLINQRLDIVSILKKLLDFDRFKNLVLKDYQLILLNSLSRHLLDPETVNLVDFNNITFDKLTDAIVEASNSNNIIDYNLREFIKLKYELDCKVSDSE